MTDIVEDGGTEAGDAEAEAGGTRASAGGAQASTGGTQSGTGGTQGGTGGVEPGEVYTVVGTVSSPDRAGVGGLYVEIVDRNVGQDALLTHTLTDERGRYQARFNKLWWKKQPDL